jgi:hypothetical protein
MAVFFPLRHHLEHEVATVGQCALHSYALAAVSV